MRLWFCAPSMKSRLTCHRAVSPKITPYRGLLICCLLRYLVALHSALSLNSGIVTLIYYSILNITKKWVLCFVTTVCYIYAIKKSNHGCKKAKHLQYHLKCHSKFEPARCCFAFSDQKLRINKLMPNFSHEGKD